MAPTLADQDRLVVSKWQYHNHDPRLGDIVMLRYPLAPEKSFVKRVIGREGDAVRIVDGKVFRNDVPVDDSYVPPEYRSHDTWGPRVIPQGYYFVMGDHRNNSSDSTGASFPRSTSSERYGCAGGRRRQPNSSDPEWSPQAMAAPTRIRQRCRSEQRSHS